MPFRPATPPANLPKFPRLDLGLCKGPPGGGTRCVTLPALDGLNPCFGTSDNALSLTFSMAALGGAESSSSRRSRRWALLAFSWTLLNFSSSSVHLIAPSSRGLRRFDRSKGVVGVWGLLLSLASFLFHWTWTEVSTYARGVMWRYPIALTLFNLFLSAAKAED